MATCVGGLLSLMRGDGISQVSQVSQEDSVVVTEKKKGYREWSDESVQFFLDLLFEKYWETDRRQFKEKNWVEFTRKVNDAYPIAPSEDPRTWHQCRDK